MLRRSRGLTEGNALPAFQLTNESRNDHHGNPSRSAIRDDLHLHALPDSEFLPVDEQELRTAAGGDPHGRRRARDPAIWTFATGEKPQIEELTRSFAVSVQPGSGTLSHSLATALIDGNGRVAEGWRGNGWKREEVVSRIESL
jgi:hypothetical protein